MKSSVLVPPTRHLTCRCPPWHKIVIVPRPASDAVIARGARDRIAVVRAHYLREIADRIGGKACRRSCRQIDRRSAGRVREIDRVGAAVRHSAYRARRRVNIVVARTARDAVIARGTRDRIVVVRTDYFMKLVIVSVA